MRYFVNNYDHCTPSRKKTKFKVGFDFCMLVEYKSYKSLSKKEKEKFHHVLVEDRRKQVEIDRFTD